jgi:transposase
LEIVHPHAAGIDVGNKSHFVGIKPGSGEPAVQEFGSWTADLKRMVGWLKSQGVESVAMQSTGVYWIALYEELEQAGFEVYLVNARGTRNLPGRKSDVQECQWLRKLHTYGLLRNSFRPAEEIRALRTLWRLRERHVREAGRAIEQMQKALTTMNVQLGGPRERRVREKAEGARAYRLAAKSVSDGVAFGARPSWLNHAKQTNHTPTDLREVSRERGAGHTMEGLFPFRGSRAHRLE